MRFLLIVLLLTSYVSTAQFLTMLEENHTWSVDINGEDFDGNMYTLSIDINLSGNMVVNGKTYHIVQTPITETSLCLVREENGMVFRYNDDIDDEIVVYDFNLGVGDSFTFYQFDEYCTYYGDQPNNPETVQVEDTWVDFVAGENRKHIRFELYDGSEIWIEGIGSLRGFETGGEVFDVVTHTELVCFKVDSDIYFFNGASSCDNTTLGIDQIQKQEVVLYPNPVRGVSILRLLSFTNAEFIQIFNISGEMVRQDPIESASYQISAMNYASGLYFYRLISGGKTLTHGSFIIK